MSLKILIFYFFSSIFFLTNNLFASHVTVVDGDTIYWEVDGRRLSHEEAKKLQEEIDNEYFENSNDDN